MERFEDFSRFSVFACKLLERAVKTGALELKVDLFLCRFSSLVPRLAFRPKYESFIVFGSLTVSEFLLLELELEWLPISADIVPSKYWPSSLIFFEF